MVKPSDITWSHREVDHAIGRLVSKVFRHDEAGDPSEIRRAVGELADALREHFSIEDEISDAADDMFGGDIAELQEIYAKREELWSVARQLLRRPLDSTLHARLHTAFEEYTELEWTFQRCYSGLMSPGTSGS